MTGIEALRAFSFQHEQDRALRECGLIDPGHMHEFESSQLEEADIQQFDFLSEAADGGLVMFRDKEWMIDSKLENGNIVRSTLEPLEQDDAGNVLAKVRTHIAHRNGKNYFHTHHCKIAPDGSVIEPAVGSDDVKPGTYLDAISHGLIAYGGEVRKLSAV